MKRQFLAKLLAKSVSTGETCLFLGETSVESSSEVNEPALVISMSEGLLYKCMSCCGTIFNSFSRTFGVGRRKALKTSLQHFLKLPFGGRVYYSLNVKKTEQL